MGTNCAPPLVDLFLFSYESEFLQTLVKTRRSKKPGHLISHSDILMVFFPFTIQTFLIGSINISPRTRNQRNNRHVFHSFILDIYLKDVNEFYIHGHTTTRIYDKRDDFKFEIINFPLLSSNIPASPAYGIYISNLIRYPRAYNNYTDFVKCHQCLSRELMNQGYAKEPLDLFLKKEVSR